MPPVYSEPLLYGRGSDTIQTLIVPPSKRVVVRFVSVICFTTSPGYVAFRVGGVPIVWMLSPTADVTKHFDVRVVALAGHAIEISVGVGDIAWHVSGFMFNDE